MYPSSGCSKPASMRSVVVLPQPDGPSRDRNSPRSDLEVDVVDGGDGSEVLGQLDEFHRTQTFVHPASPFQQRGSLS